MGTFFILPGFCFWRKQRAKKQKNLMTPPVPFRVVYVVVEYYIAFWALTLCFFSFLFFFSECTASKPFCLWSSPSASKTNKHCIKPPPPLGREKRKTPSCIFAHLCNSPPLCALPSSLSRERNKQDSHTFEDLSHNLTFAPKVFPLLCSVCCFSPVSFSSWFLIPSSSLGA